MAEHQSSAAPVAADAVALPRALADEIVEHARAGKPEEICGILRGRGLTATALVRGRNVAADKIDNYEVDPQTLLLQFDFEDEGDEMMGIYHSHPVSEAYPSATDAWNAHYPDSIYFICSLEDDDRPVIRAFGMSPFFVELDLPALAASLDFYETRPGLFGYFVGADDALPANLPPGLVAEITQPFYLVYATEDGRPESGDGRAVAIREFHVVVTPEL